MNKIWGNKDDELKRQFVLELQTRLAETDLIKAQIDVNKVEASNSNIWVSGWRPFIGWVCGAAFAWQFVLLPIVQFCGSNVVGHALLVPVFDTTTMISILGGLLGLGAMRSYDKRTGK